jgi:hypothetical protein
MRNSLGCCYLRNCCGRAGRTNRVPRNVARWYPSIAKYTPRLKVGYLNWYAPFGVPYYALYAVADHVKTGCERFPSAADVAATVPVTLLLLGCDTSHLLLASPLTSLPCCRSQDFHFSCKSASRAGRNRATRIEGLGKLRFYNLFSNCCVRFNRRKRPIYLRV